MDKVQIRELLELSAPSRVSRDEATGEIIVEGVKYLGPRSSNVNSDGTHNEYPLEGRIKSEPLYDGASIYLNHPGRDEPGRERGYQEKLGRLRNTVGRSTEEGSFGDLHLNPEHPLAGQVAWDAEHSPDSLGLSHNAQGEGHVEGKSDKCTVTVTNVRSVDIVAAAATTSSLFESVAPMTIEPETVEETPEIEEPVLEAEQPVEEQPEAVDTDALEALRAEVAELKAAAAETERLAGRTRLIAESNLPSEVLSDIFVEQVKAATDDDTAKALLEDRRRVAFHQTPETTTTTTTPPEKSAEDFRAWMRS